MPRRLNAPHNRPESRSDGAALTTVTLLALHRERAGEIRDRLREFAAVPPGEYLYELLYCLLTPQSSALNAGSVVSLLRGRNFMASPFDPEPVLADRRHYIRFHRTKAKRLLEAHRMFRTIAEHLDGGRSPAGIRAWLVRNVGGLGMKEASHFLRNIGRRDLAILDRHILRNLVRAGILEKIPKTLTEKSYLSIEKKFSDFALGTGIPMDELDLLFWSLETGQILK